jgi:hypothetical protein
MSHFFEAHTTSRLQNWNPDRFSMMEPDMNSASLAGIVTGEFSLKEAALADASA